MSINLTQLNQINLNDYREKTTIYFSVIGIVALVVFGTANIVANNFWIGVSEVVFGGLASLNLVLFQFFKKTSFATISIMVMIYLVFMLLFLQGGISETATYWYFTFPILAFLLRGRKEGLAWMTLFYCSLLSLQIIGYYGGFQLINSWGQFRQLIATLMVVSTMVYIYEYLTEKAISLLSESSENLQREMQLKEVESQERESTKSELEKNVNELEQTKKAMLNLLEDLENEKKQAEKVSNDLQKFQLAVENANDQIVITDKDAIILYVNPATQKITGYSPQEIIGKKAGSKELWGGLEKPEFYKQLWKTIKIDKQTFTGKVRNRRKNGTEYHAQVSISPITNEQNEVTFFVAIERDITKEEQVDQAKTEFVSLASHQLKTPLSAINWYTELLQSPESGKLTKEQQEYVNEIAQGSHRMVDLVNALLNVSRLELGTFIIEPKKTNLLQLLRSVLDELKQISDGKNLKIEEKHSQVPQIDVDEKLTRIIFQNLLSNAIKYTPDGGSIQTNLELVKAGTMVAQKKLEEDSVVLSVKDTGYGIPADQQDKIFTKLFRADNVLEKDTNGTGLGLYIIKQVLESSGGMIWFESELNKGSTFYITIPASGMKSRKGTKALNPFRLESTDQGVEFKNNKKAKKAAPPSQTTKQRSTKKLER